MASIQILSITAIEFRGQRFDLNKGEIKNPKGFTRKAVPVKGGRARVKRESAEPTLDIDTPISSYEEYKTLTDVDCDSMIAVTDSGERYLLPQCSWSEDSGFGEADYLSVTYVFSGELTVL